MAASSFVSRKTLALALAAGGALTALLGGQAAKAQNSFNPSTAALVANTNRQNAEAANSSGIDGSAYMEELKREEAIDAQKANKSPHKQIVVDTDANRNFGRNLYKTYIGEVLKTKNSNEASKFIQHPENNPTFRPYISNTHDGNELLAGVIIGFARKDAQAWLDSGRKGGIPTLTDARLESGIMFSQGVLDKRDATDAELVSMNRAYITPGYFSNQNIAAGVYTVLLVKSPNLLRGNSLVSKAITPPVPYSGH